jgi:hypothetical protein
VIVPSPNGDNAGAGGKGGAVNGELWYAQLWSNIQAADDPRQHP